MQVRNVNGFVSIKEGPIEHTVKVNNLLSRTQRKGWRSMLLEDKKWMVILEIL